MMITIKNDDNNQEWYAITMKEKLRCDNRAENVKFRIFGRLSSIWRFLPHFFLRWTSCPATNWHTCSQTTKWLWNFSIPMKRLALLKFHLTLLLNTASMPLHTNIEDHTFSFSEHLVRLLCTSLGAHPLAGYIYPSIQSYQFYGW